MDWCVWFHDFVVEVVILVVSVFSSYLLWFFHLLWLFNPSIHVCFVVSLSLSVSFSHLFLVKIFSVWIANDYWLLYWLGIYGCLTRFLSSLVNWQSVVDEAKCVGKQSNTHSNLYLGWDMHIHALFIHTCVVKFHALANSTTLYVLISRVLYTICFSFFSKPYLI